MNKINLIFKQKLKENGIKKIVYLLIYKWFLKHLPASTNLILGKFSKKIRYSCCKNIFLKCGQNVNIERGADFGSGFDLVIGDNSGIGVNCKVPSNIVIGENVMMGPNCYILDTNHQFQDINIPMVLQGHLNKMQTTINDDVWIGRDVLFTPGRIVSRGFIVAARCVLSKDFPPYSIIGGNPSKLLRSRVK